MKQTRSNLHYTAPVSDPTKLLYDDVIIVSCETVKSTEVFCNIIITLNLKAKPCESTSQTSDLPSKVRKSKMVLMAWEGKGLERLTELLQTVATRNY